MLSLLVIEHSLLLPSDMAEIWNSSETDGNGASIEQDLIDVDEWMTAGLPETNYQQRNEYGLVSGVDY